MQADCDRRIPTTLWIRSPKYLIPAFVALLMVGCRGGDELSRVVVTGEIRLNGAVVEHGQIRFIPQLGTTGPVFIQEVLNGKYVCDRLGGVPIGAHRVEILAWDPAVPLPTGPGQPTPKQLAPEKYNVKSDLVITIDNTSNPLVKDYEL